MKKEVRGMLFGGSGRSGGSSSSSSGVNSGGGSDKGESQPKK